MALRCYVRDEDVYFPTGEGVHVGEGWLYITNNNVELLVRINPVVGLGRGTSYKVAYEYDFEKNVGHRVTKFSEVLWSKELQNSGLHQPEMLNIEVDVQEITDGELVVHNWQPWSISSNYPYFYTYPIKHDNDIEGRITMYVDTARKDQTNGLYSAEYPFSDWAEYILHALSSSTKAPDMDVEKILRDKSCPEGLSFEGIKVTKGYMTKGFYFEMREGLLFKKHKSLTFEELLMYLWARWKEQVGLS